jgi:dipeptidyl aminopeptidase/acylaminoacyl peptidase
VTPPLWERRFRAPLVAMPEWSPYAPDRVTFASNETGVWQLHAVDVATGQRRRVTDHPVGVNDGSPTADGTGVVWFQDETGDESGRWFIQPFEGGDPRPFVDGVPVGWNEGLAQRLGVTVVVMSDRDGFHVLSASDGLPARVIRESREFLTLGEADFAFRGFDRSGLSADGSLLCLQHSEHGDLIHPALVVVDPRTGETIGEQFDPGMSLRASCWSPVASDQRVAIVHEREGDEQPAIWDLSTGERTDLPVALEGGILRVDDWWPDASALLLAHTFEGRDRLWRFRLSDGELSPVNAPTGLIAKARVRPDGRVWFLQSQGDRPPRALDDAGAEVVAPHAPDGSTLGRDGRGPAGRPYEPWAFANPHGQTVHGFVVRPDLGSAGPPPWPVIMFVHGGPTSLDMDRWQPEVQAYADAGFVVGMASYRGSVGYGREWRDVLIGNIGGPELEDVDAGLDDLVRRGLADPGRAVVAGWSWGGFVTLLELGKHPERWVCGVAGVPVGDYAMGYDELSPLLQAYDRALLGGKTPHEMPELMADRSPINFADQVKAPVLFLIGENDSRCPYRQAMAYVQRLAARGHPHEVYTYATGHSSFDVDERVRQVGTILDFLKRNVRVS